MVDKAGLVAFSVLGTLMVVFVFLHWMLPMGEMRKIPVGTGEYANAGGRAEITVPAVDSKGKGVLGKFEVQVVPGEGKTLANIDNLLYFVDTQFSIQTAKAVAANVTGIDISGYNLVYGIEAESGEPSVVEGPSAGAALTIATIAALENKTLDPEVAITGTINPDGTIGRVGGIKSKLGAVGELGVKVFLVPQGQGMKPSFKVGKECENVGGVKFCRTEYRPQQSLFTSESGVIVREVPNISEALKYFLQ